MTDYPELDGPIAGITMTGLYVADLDRSVAFYRALGIPLVVDAHDDYHHAEYSFHDPYYHLALFAAAGDAGVGGAHVGFAVTDCEAAFKRAKDAGASVVNEPRTMPWGLAATVLDPDGNHVEFVEPQS